MGLIARIRGLLKQLIEGTPTQALARPGVIAIYLLRLLVQVVRQWIADRCPQQAASLAFQTALSLAPLLFVALALMRGFGMLEEGSQLVDYLAHQVIAVSPDEISKYLTQWAANFNFGTAGTTGLFATMFLAFVMYNNVEQIFNDIWRVDRRRSLAHRAVIFYVVVTVVPTLLGFSIYQATQLGFMNPWAQRLLSLAATWLGLLLANKLLPRAEVRWRPAAIGALVSALAFEIAKLAFQIYVARVAFQSYSGVYGALAIIPLFLVWIYYTWVVVLLGAEIAHATQNLHLLERRRRLLSAAGETPVPDGVWGLKVATAVARHFTAGGKVLGRSQIVAVVGAPEEVLDGTLRRLRDGGILLEIEQDGDLSGYVPARPLEQVTAADILGLFRAGDFTRHGAADGRTPPDKLDKLLEAIDTEVKGKTTAVTLAELSAGETMADQERRRRSTTTLA